MSRWGSSLVCLAFALAWFASLGVRPLYKPDEARYGEIPREMVASGDWLTPRLNGFQYFEKPPLQYWATAVAYKIFGVGDWSARLWTGLTALAGILMVLIAGSLLFDAPAGVYAAAILASTPLYVLFGQANTLDMGVTFFLSAAVFAFALAQREPAEPGVRRRWMLVFWGACGLAVLSKGLIGIVLPAVAVALYVLLRREWALLLRLELFRGGVLFLAVAAPWFVAVSLANPEFFHFFFVQEHWQRFTTTMHGRQHPAWFFVPVLAAGMWPWLLVAIGAWAAALWRHGDAQFSPRFFLAVWAASVFAFFSASGSKLPGYIVPLVPALATLCGEWLARGQRSGLLVAQALLVAAAALAIGGGAWHLADLGDASYYGLGGVYAPWLAAAATVTLAGGVAAAALAILGRSAASAGALVLGTASAALLALSGHVVFAPAYSVAQLVRSLPQPPSPGARIYTVHAYDHSIPWSLRRPVTMVIYKDELAQAIAWEPDKFIPDLAAFARAWDAGGEAYAFFAVLEFEQFRRQLAVPMEVVARGPRYLIVRKP